MANFHYRGFKEEKQKVLTKSSVSLFNSEKSKSSYQKTLKDSVGKTTMENTEKFMSVKKQPEDFLTKTSLEYSSPVEDRRTSVDDHSFAGKNVVFSLTSPVWTLKKKGKDFNHESLFKKDIAIADSADYDQEPNADEKDSFIILGLSLVGAICLFVVNASKSNRFKSKAWPLKYLSFKSIRNVNLNTSPLLPALQRLVL